MKEPAFSSPPSEEEAPIRQFRRVSGVCGAIGCKEALNPKSRFVVSGSRFEVSGLGLRQDVRLRGHGVEDSKCSP